jgi:hypothetical protein
MTKAHTTSQSRKTSARSTAEPRLSRQRKPADLPVDDWQRALRRQFGREQPFSFENLGDDPVFSEFSVFNPDSRRRYRVAIRGAQAGDNHCSCPDFATNDLGTCKHIEFTLAQISARPGGKRTLEHGFQGSFSELFLDYTGQRRVRLRLGSDFPAELQSSMRQLFEETSGWQLSPQRFAELPAFVDSVRALGHDLRCAEDALSFVAEVRDGEIRRQTLTTAYPLGADSAGDRGHGNPELKATAQGRALRPYQREGALFVKNWNTIAARALKRIDSPYAIVLTGTPLENRLEELISIVQFVDQHRLGPTWRLLDEHQQRDERGRVVGYRELHRIGQTLAPIMLRRRKSEVLEQLPERVDNTLFMPMSPLQAEHHEENRQTVARIVQRWRHTGFLSEKDQLRLHCSLQNMRMACNSSFLIDHETDDGYKADELLTLLDDLFDDPQAKVVVFSQWLRTHELIIRRLKTRGWEHVLFHGGVPGDKRGALVDRFNNDPACRVFLSTDAGGVGLNLQHAAAVVVNMDLPWNPAVLEQRIGRVHRLGQTRGVQVINFVARGTIEEGMLSILAFKQSLFAGILDGGESEVVLQGTRLSKFMETVEQVSGAAESTAPMDESSEDTLPLDATAAAGSETEADGEAEYRQSTPAGEAGQPPVAEASTRAEPPTSAPAAVSGGADPWAPLLAAGVQLLGELTAASSGERESPWVQTDSTTGQRYLKLPVPDPQTVQRLAEGLLSLLGGRK